MSPDEERDFALDGVEAAYSPNVGPRRGVAGPNMVVLHYTGMESPEAALERLRDPAAEVSAHYLIDEDGRIFGVAPERLRAWHAGVSSWGGRQDVNSLSIGVELAHPGPVNGAPLTPYPEAQYVALERLLRAVTARWRIPRWRVLGHSDVAPGRKIDPGESFDWPRLGAIGLVINPSDLHLEAAPQLSRGGEAFTAFTAAARQFGYGDWPRDTVLDAARRRFHWWMGPESLAACFAACPPPPTSQEIAFFRALSGKWPASAEPT